MSCGLYDVWLSLHMHPGNSAHRELFGIFGDAYDVYRADPAAYEAAGLSERLCAALSDKSLERAGAVMDYCTRTDVRGIRHDLPISPMRRIFCISGAESPISIRLSAYRWSERVR